MRKEGDRNPTREFGWRESVKCVHVATACDAVAMGDVIADSHSMRLIGERVSMIVDYC
jgi:hypothetical protein